LYAFAPSLSASAEADVAATATTAASNAPRASLEKWKKDCIVVSIASCFAPEDSRQRRVGQGKILKNQ
jgi:hypothetical protein